MRPRSRFIVKRSAARCIITLFDRGILQPQERLNHASPGRLRGREDELRAVNCTTVIGPGEVNNRGVTDGCTNDNGADKNDAASKSFSPNPTVRLPTRLNSVLSSIRPMILINASQRQRQISCQLSQKRQFAII